MSSQNLARLYMASLLSAGSVTEAALAPIYLSFKNRRRANIGFFPGSIW